MNEMTFQLGTDGTKCLYEQIYEHIKKEIKAGKLLSGEKLPSTRFLAEYLQVARSTVDYAYGQLLSEGYIEARPCKGYFVCPTEELLQLDGIDQTEESLFGSCIEGKTGGRALDQTEERSWGIAREACSSFETDTELHGKGGFLVDFSPYEIDMSGFPFSVWKKITKNILTFANSEPGRSGTALYHREISAFFPWCELQAGPDHRGSGK